MPTVDHRQMKICSTCFDVTVSLLRTIEMIICVAPNIMLDKHSPKCEMLLIRLLQVKDSPGGEKRKHPIISFSAT